MEVKEEGILFKLYKLSIKNVPFFKYSGSLIITILVLSIAGYAKLDNIDVFRYSLFLLLLSLLGFVFSTFINSKDKIIKAAFYILVYSIIITIATCILGFASYILVQKPIFYKRWFPDMQSNHQISDTVRNDTKKINYNNEVKKKAIKKKRSPEITISSNQLLKTTNTDTDVKSKVVSFPAIYISTEVRGVIKFDYSNNNGRFIIGKGDYSFETTWSKASNTSIHAYTDGSGIKSLRLVSDKNEINKIKSINLYDSSSRVRTPQIKEIIVWENQNGYYAATKILNIKDRTQGDLNDELLFEYVININKADDFSK